MATSRKVRALCFFVLALVVLCTTLPAVGQQFGGSSYIDPGCITDDENFVRLFDFLAFLFAFSGSLVIPLFWPFIPGTANKWTWSSPSRRWWTASATFAAIFVILVFLPPQLSRVGLIPRSIGMYLYQHVGNVRPVYLGCDLTSIPRDYGFFFFFRWNPGPNSLIQYWWAQLVVFFVWMTIFGVVYLLVVRLAPPRRLEAFGQ